MTELTRAKLWAKDDKLYIIKSTLIDRIANIINISHDMICPFVIAGELTNRELNGFIKLKKPRGKKVLSVPYYETDFELVDGDE